MPRHGTAEAPSRPPEEISPFDLDEATSGEMVQKYRPQFLGRGGEKLVYEISGRPNIVVKVDKRVMRYVQEWNATHGSPPDACPVEMRADLLRLAARKKAQTAELARYFGRAHVPVERHAVVKIPVNEKILRDVHEHPSPEILRAREAWTVVMVQRREPELPRGVSLDVSSRLVEEHVKDPDAYRRITRALVDLDPAAAYTDHEYFELHGTDIAQLHLFVANSDELRPAVQDFTSRAIRYTKETGEALDVIGANNVIFVYRDGAWTYRLIDAVLPSITKDTMTEVRTTLLRAAKGDNFMTVWEQFNLYAALHYARIINGLARRLGVSERIDIIPDNLKGKIDFYEMWQHVNQ